MTILNPSDVLNINQTPEELNKVYEDDYYWYLRHPEFQRKFLSIIGAFVEAIEAGSCLDIGCGEGQLLNHLPNTLYQGIDGSEVAIRNAKTRWPSDEFSVARIEDYKDAGAQYDVIVFGGILSVLIKPECRLDFVLRYIQELLANYFIVYDLEELQLNPKFGQLFQLVGEWHATANLKGIPEVKKHRKILVYKCH